MRAIKSSHADGDPEMIGRFDRVLGEAVEAVEDAAIPYAFIGGIASGGLGRPRGTHDIDIFVRPEDAEKCLRALATRGFRIERTDPNWLYKGFKENVLVDVIFKSKGEIYLDSEMSQRTVTAEFHGKKLRFVSPEDLIIIKAAAHSELTPGHWHDALGLLSHANLDWDYLIRRAKRAPRRVLSLLLYAQSSDIWVPNKVIHELFRGLFGEADLASETRSRAPQSRRSVVNHQRPSPSAHQVTHQASESYYVVPHLRQILAEDPRTNELDVQIEQSGDIILLRGEVPTPERKAAAEQVSREVCPEFKIENQMKVSHYEAPVGSEEVG